MAELSSYHCIRAQLDKNSYLFSLSPVRTLSSAPSLNKEGDIRRRSKRSGKKEIF